ncbi:hypothetical protein GH975_07700 [Litorivicinus lipolyticus]|uniref:histidine kinase n=1 Tax=Litorivicinus lipolyticus TaxID=418701 RepID=A0A5Q2QB18_9GAMM|nr:sensor histidine kinase [Litorivicinus lipolyticus]QGG80463.1 hypothetical protein GH975_07700 [Litorivicinus lipolyticus]
MSKPNRSISRVLFIQLACLIGLLAAAAYLITGFVAFQSLQNNQDNRLSSVARVIADSVVLRGSTIDFDLPYAAFDVLTYQAPESIFYRVTDPSGATLAGYPSLQAPTAGSHTGEHLGLALRTFTISKVLQDDIGAVTITLGQTQDSLRDAVARLAQRSALGAMTAFVLVSIAVFAALRAGLRPLRAIERALSRRVADDFSPLADEVPREIHALVVALNDSMRQHGELLDQTRRFIAESTHQIKTPIASLSAEADLLVAQAPADLKPEIGALAVHARQTSHLINQLLTQASITYGLGARTPIETQITRLIDSVIESFGVQAEARDIEIVNAAGGPIAHAVDPVGLREALVCLIDNALKFAPPLSDIRVSAWLDQGLWIRVQDQGTGFAGNPERLKQPFARGDNNLAGSGLGLSIAERVAQAGGGHLTLQNHPRGGAQCELYLP